MPDSPETEDAIWVWAYVSPYSTKTETHFVNPRTDLHPDSAIAALARRLVRELKERNV